MRPISREMTRQLVTIVGLIGDFVETRMTCDKTTENQESFLSILGGE
jgi:hypothetical protein